MPGLPEGDVAIDAANAPMSLVFFPQPLRRCRQDASSQLELYSPMPQEENRIQRRNRHGAHIPKRHIIIICRVSARVPVDVVVEVRQRWQMVCSRLRRLPVHKPMVPGDVVEDRYEHFPPAAGEQGEVGFEFVHVAGPLHPELLDCGGVGVVERCVADCALLLGGLGQWSIIPFDISLWGRKTYRDEHAPGIRHILHAMTCNRLPRLQRRAVRIQRILKQKRQRNPRPGVLLRSHILVHRALRDT